MLLLLQTGIYRRVAMRFASICHHTLSSCFLTWHAFVVERRHHLHTALEHRRLLVLRRTLGAWRDKAKEYREVRCSIIHCIVGMTTALTLLHC